MGLVGCPAKDMWGHRGTHQEGMAGWPCCGMWRKPKGMI